MPDSVETSANGGEDKLRVGDWTVERSLNRISARGNAIKLEPKAMALLHYLAERPGEVVSREALLAAVWPGVVVGDDSLTQAIIKLRKALGDRSESPAYIETISKRGYRLIAPVSHEAVGGGATEVLSQGPPGRSRARVAAIVVVALVLCIGVAWLIVVDERKAANPLAPVAVEASRAAKPAIRIAPFEALGADAQALLIARGMTADLVTDLSKVFELSVVTDTKEPEQGADGPAERPATIRYLVSGSVQVVEGKLRLNVQLTDTQTNTQLWSERYDRAVTSLFALQDELVPRLLGILPAKVSEAELRRVSRHHTRNLEAYEHYQRGQMALIVRRPQENELAKEMFQRAIALDASFALAYAALAQTYAADHRNRWTKDTAQALERAFELARTAHQINPDVRETYWVLAFVHLERGEHRQALAHLENAIRLYPSYADAYAFMGGIYAYLGEPSQCLALLRTAIRLRPEAGYLYFLILGRAYFGLNDLEQARMNLEQALMRNPVNVEARVYAAATAASAGRSAEAAWEAEEIRALQPDFDKEAWFATHPLRDARTKARLLEALGKAGL